MVALEGMVLLLLLLVLVLALVLLLVLLVDVNGVVVEPLLEGFGWAGGEENGFGGWLL